MDETKRPAPEFRRRVREMIGCLLPSRYADLDVSSGNGSGCSVCSETIEGREVRYILRDEHAHLCQLHDACFDVWITETRDVRASDLDAVTAKTLLPRSR